MKNLFSILEVKDQIQALAQDFGFKPSLKVMKNPGSNSLDLLLEELPNISYKNREYLKVKLIELLGCEVTIAIARLETESSYSLVQAVYQDRSAEFETSALEDLFEEDLVSITFAEADSNDILNKILLEQADEFLKKGKFTSSSSTLFAKPNTSSPANISINRDTITTTFAIDIHDDSSIEKRNAIM